MRDDEGVPEVRREALNHVGRSLWRRVRQTREPAGQAAGPRRRLRRTAPGGKGVPVPTPPRAVACGRAVAEKRQIQHGG